jgi:hypothetical protein
VAHIHLEDQAEVGTDPEARIDDEAEEVFGVAFLAETYHHAEDGYTLRGLESLEVQAVEAAGLAGVVVAVP